MAHEKLRPEYFFDESKIEQLKQIAPECFEDGKINFETLRENLGDWSQNQDDPELEHFGLFWPGKRDARKAAALPPEGTLEPVWGDGLKSDGSPDKDGQNDSKNIFIEGENLEVLKLLQKSYAGKIKMIYIDPPYNTGNDFVYDDDFTEPLQEYLRRTGQVDEEGKSLTTNKRSDGRFHSKWLSMMYPRLRLARNLLREDGVVFVSIDDNEVHNLRAILNEIFGEENFISEFVWKSRQNKDNRSVTGVSNDHEYILSFTRGKIENVIRGDRRKTNQYKNPDNDSRGPWVSGNMVGLLPENLRPNCHYDLINPETEVNYGRPKLGWRYDMNTMTRLIEEKRILWPNSIEGRPRRKVFLSELKGDFTGLSSLFGDDIFTRDGTKEIDDLFGYKAFDFPKPSLLIKQLIMQTTNDEDIIMDFFAGSGTTAHAVFAINKEENTNRNFICVQIPAGLEENSEAYRNGYKNIASLSKERIRRVIKSNDASGDYKSLALTFSNYKPWKNYNGTSVKQLEIELEKFNNSPLREGFSKDGLLTEIMLLEGFTLCSLISSLDEINTNTIKKISSEFDRHNLLVCLDDKIAKETISNLSLGDEDIFICLDSAISTEDKLRLSDKGLIKTI